VPSRALSYIMQHHRISEPAKWDIWTQGIDLYSSIASLRKTVQCFMLHYTDHLLTSLALASGEGGNMAPHGMSDKPVPISSTTVLGDEERKSAGIPKASLGAVPGVMISSSLSVFSPLLFAGCASGPVSNSSTLPRYD
jgi:hypothetical protein